MKKLMAFLLAATVILGIMMTGCSGSTEKSPDKFSKIRWITPDYSFRFTPDDDCKGKYVFGEKTYNIRLEFSGGGFKALDTDKNNAELFNGLWKYEDEKLFVYNIMFNTESYKEFESNYSEFYKFNKEKL